MTSGDDIIGGLAPLVVIWKGWGIQVMVLLSFAVQATLLVLADIRRRKDSIFVNAIIWSSYVLADTTAVYALGHMSVVCRSPEHHLMGLWAPLLLVHLGGQDNITAYAIEDNRLWLRHLQVFGVQVTAAAYVLYASSVLLRPSFLRWATILMSVVGVLKYGERVWALMAADNCASSSLSANSYKDFRAEKQDSLTEAAHARHREEDLVEDRIAIAYSLLDVPKRMFEGPTRYVKVKRANRCYTAKYMLGIAETQLSMMYDLLYTKAAVVQTWYGMCIHVMSTPFTIAALVLYASSGKHGYTRADVAVTYVLLTGAVVLETMSVLRAIFSSWTAALLFDRKLHRLARVVAHVTSKAKQLVRSAAYWSGSMRQLDLFNVFSWSNVTAYAALGSFLARLMGRQDWWDSTFFSWSTSVRDDITNKVLELVEDSQIDISKSRGLTAIRRRGYKELEWSVGLDLDESILVWHIATNVYTVWFKKGLAPRDLVKAAETLSNYMLYLLAARPYILPYPVSRQRYVQLCYASHDHLRRCHPNGMLDVIFDQKAALIKGSPLKPDLSRGIIGLSTEDSPSRPMTDTGAVVHLTINRTLDKGCQLAALLIHKTLQSFRNPYAILETIFQVWAEMLCYTAYWCNEKSHAKNLNNGGEIMTILSLMMVYMSNGFIDKKNRDEADTSSGGASTGGMV